jgi:hypothetical protein
MVERIGPYAGLCPGTQAEIGVACGSPGIQDFGTVGMPDRVAVIDHAAVWRGQGDVIQTGDRLEELQGVGNGLRPCR